MKDFHAARGQCPLQIVATEYRRLLVWCAGEGREETRLSQIHGPQTQWTTTAQPCPAFGLSRLSNANRIGAASAALRPAQVQGMAGAENRSLWQHLDLNLRLQKLAGRDQVRGKPQIAGGNPHWAIRGTGPATIPPQSNVRCRSRELQSPFAAIRPDPRIPVPTPRCSTLC